MAKIEFEKIDPNSHEQAREYISWFNDPIMQKNWLGQRPDKEREPFSIEDFKKQFGEDHEEYGPKMTFMIKVDAKYCGYGQYYINHPVSIEKKGKGCWPSLAIGDSNYRGKGIGLALCMEIKRLAIEDNCTHIEAAIFEFNQPMKSIIEQSGFKKIGSKEKITCIDGKWYSGEHYILKLNS